MNLVQSAPELKSKSAAPAQYLGFSLQQTRLCFHLLMVPDDASVSLEQIDDLTVHFANGSKLLEQCKSSTSGKAASDRSEELWKTFANWSDLCAVGLDVASTKFQLYITPANVGPLAATLHAAISDDSATAALKRIKALIDQKKPDVGCSPYVAKFLALGDEHCIQIIKNFNVVAEDDAVETIRELLRASLPKETLDAFCVAAIGMARELADTLISKKMPAIVSAVEFRKRFHAFVRKYDLLGLLLSNAPEPTKEVIEAIVNTSPIFVRQLLAVGASDEMLVTAVSDYLRADTDRINWADEGVIFPNSLEELDRQLERQHAISRDEIEDIHSHLEDKVRGRALYRKCSQTDFPLEGRALPSHFVAGSFNWLADAAKLGWHPDYKKLFPL